MSETLLTFQRFNDIDLANEFAERLNQLGIYCEIDNQTAPFDVTYANNPLENDVRLKLKPADFAKANAALDEYYKSQLDTVDKEYYLFQFTDNELMEIIAKPDEWNRLDYQLAQKLLKEHGKEVQPEMAAKLQNERIADLSKSEKTPSYWIYAGYIAPLLTVATGLTFFGMMIAIPGALMGLIISLLLLYSKKTLPDGNQVYMYTAGQRRHAKIILAISIASFAFWYIGIMSGWFVR